MEYAGRDILEVMREARNYNEYLLELVLGGINPGDAVIDFGAGSGTFALPVAEAGHRIACVEPDPALSMGLSGHGLRVLPDIEQVENQSVDHLYTLNVLEHIEDDAAVVRLWHEKLRPGGTVMVYVPAFQLLFSSMDSKVGHYRRYRKGALCRLLRDAGLEIVEARYADSLGFLAALIYKALGRENGEIDPRMLVAFDRLVFPLSRFIDRVAFPLFGKNVYVRAVKPG